ncbi:MAG TPA: hypothetical protein VFT66_14270 [Roseiflexaceae bacterium]|nr:hypothetical protein [Roseiflexaceae bacterium]
MAIERRPQGWRPFSDFARVWQPLRLKGILVGTDEGTPFLAATQVFDIRPVARKWLALERTSAATERFVHPGQILVTCSGAVGRATLAYAPHANTLISHDLLRVDTRDVLMRGWIYAYLRSPQARAMMSGAQYGHIIKHLETTHLNALPVPEVDAATAADFEQRVARLLGLRNESYRHILEAERLFAESFGSVTPFANEAAFACETSHLSGGRRRMEANFHAPEVKAILRRIKTIGSASTVGEVTERVWWMTRFKRFFGEGGIPYVSADELFSINPTETKQILADAGDNHENYFVRAGWLVMACSGQVYGLNGSAMLMTHGNEAKFFSHDLIRIIPKKDTVRPGYLLTALTHPKLGRPLVIRHAYGTSIPHLDPADVSDIPVVRFPIAIENAIADHAEASAETRAEADELERKLAEDAGHLIDEFIAGR